MIKEKTHLRYNLLAAFLTGHKQHAETTMKSLGITYDAAIPQSVGDQWWFIRCQVPDGLQLPRFLEPMEIDADTLKHYGVDEESLAARGTYEPIWKRKNGQQ